VAVGVLAGPTVSAASPFIVDDAIVGLAQPLTEALNQLARGRRRACDMIEEFGRREDFYLHLAGGSSRRTAGATFHQAHLPYKLSRANRAEKDGVAIEFPEYVDGTAEEAKNTVSWISFSEEDLPLGEVRASHLGPLNRQYGDGPDEGKLSRIAETVRGADARDPHLADSSAVRGTGDYGMWGGRPEGKSLGLDAREPHHLGPLLGFRGDEAAKVRGRARNHCTAQIGEPCLKLGIGEGGVDLVVELVDDFGRRVLGRADPEPAGRFVARHEIAYSRGIRQHVRAGCGGYRERTQLAAPDVLDCYSQPNETDLHLSGDQISHDLTSTTIGHVSHIDTGHHLEQLAGYMGRTRRRRH